MNMNAKTAEIHNLMAYYQTLRWEWYPALGRDSQNHSTERYASKEGRLLFASNRAEER